MSFFARSDDDAGVITRMEDVDPELMINPVVAARMQREREERQRARLMHGKRGGAWGGGGGAGRYGARGALARLGLRVSERRDPKREELSPRSRGRKQYLHDVDQMVHQRSPTVGPSGATIAPSGATATNARPHDKATAAVQEVENAAQARARAQRHQQVARERMDAREKMTASAAASRVGARHAASAGIQSNAGHTTVL